MKKLQTTPSQIWSDRALLACLEKLYTSTLTEAWCVAVDDAWADGPDTFCVVYEAIHAGPTRVGLRRTRADALTNADSNSYVLGSFHDVGMYDLGELRNPNPEAFGYTVAEFDIGEPLGTVYAQLRYDNTGTGWWGTLEHDLPRHP